MPLKARVAVAIAVIAIVAVSLLWFSKPGNESADSLTASGTVEATDAQLGFQTAGRIIAISVNEGETVQSGAILARLDRTETEARRDQARAQAEAVQAALRELERGSRPEEVAQGRSALSAAENQLDNARRDFERMSGLYKSEVASQEAYDKTRLALDLAKSQHEQAREQLKIIETGPRQEKIDAQRAQWAQAQAAIRTLDAALVEMEIRAPFTGRVTVRHREPGEIVAAGSPVVTLMNPDDRWVRIYVPETRIGAVRIGQEAVITSDTYSGKGYKGQVVLIASEAEFTPKTIQTTEERVKLVYAVKVRIVDDPEYVLKPGIPADVRIALRNR